MKLKANILSLLRTTTQLIQQTGKILSIISMRDINYLKYFLRRYVLGLFAWGTSLFLISALFLNGHKHYTKPAQAAHGQCINSSDCAQNVLNCGSQGSCSASQCSTCYYNDICGSVSHICISPGCTPGGCEDPCPCGSGGGGNQNPIGYHDEYSGVQPLSTCRARGWATDPDDRNIDLPLRILSDGTQVTQVSANIYRGDLDAGGFCPGGTCSFDVNLSSLITPNVNHSITTQAQDAQTGGWVNLTNTPKTLNCTCPAPPAPTGLSPGSLCAPTTTLSWNAVSGATAYALRVDDLSNGWSGTCATVNPGDVCIDNLSTTNYSLPIVKGRSYNWWLHAVSSCGWSSAVSGPAFTATGIPNAPTVVSCTTNREDGVNITWNDTSSDEQGFNIIRTCAFCSIGTTAPNTTSFLDTTGTCGTTYSYNSWPYNACGTNTGAPGCFGTRLCPMPPPTLSGSPQCVPTRAALSWTSVSGATEYHIERCVGSGCTSFIEIAFQSGTTLNDTSINDYTVYRYRIRAHDHPNSRSVYSNIVDVSSSCFNMTLTQLCDPTRVQISWENPTGGSDDFHIQRCNGSTCVLPPSGSEVGTSLISPYPDTTALNNTTYRYRVFGHNHTSNGITGYSDIESITTNCPLPTPSPTPTGTLQGRAIQVNPTATDCNTSLGGISSVAGLTFTKIDAFESITLPSDQSYSIPPEVANVGTYTIGHTRPPGYSFVLTCPSTQVTVSQGINSPVTLGLSLSDNWYQVRNGNVHSNRDVLVALPANQYFLLPEASNLNAGIVSFQGSTSVTMSQLNNKGFLVDEDTTHSKAVPYYTYFNSKLGDVAPSTISTKPNGNPASCPSNVDGTCVYKSAGDLTIQTAPWNVASGERIVIFVPRQLTIGTAITVADGGFIAFIVADDPTVVDEILIRGWVGYPSPYADPSLVNPFTDANVSGLFITDGRLKTEYYSGLRQLVASGTFVANEFRFERSLGAGNNSNPGEIFIYRPDLWQNAPEALKEIEIEWQEVAP